MPTKFAKWVTDLGAEVRDRAQIGSFDAHNQRIDDLLRIITEREVAAAKPRVAHPRPSARR
jgi:hypothetical protein